MTPANFSDLLFDDVLSATSKSSNCTTFLPSSGLVAETLAHPTACARLPDRKPGPNCLVPETKAHLRRRLEGLWPAKLGERLVGGFARFGPLWETMGMLTRLILIREPLSRLHHAAKEDKLNQPDPDIGFEFASDCIQSQRLAR
jgi:hypothetical protein